ncbi:unnamed protein product [Cuscuta campestris]|uniref:Defective in cullin neddylation protein n=1 Tax=Cuscuta campestris TaxID=132261 RepID=A0A484LZG3_9ASTE|nr:unnamed protein product [Cuscuta campestris]
MPRASSKKGSSSSTTSASTMDLFRSASGKAASKELDRIDQLFYTYANNLSGLIDPEGVEALCSDLEVKHTDIRILMLAWKMQSEKQGYFTLVSRKPLFLYSLIVCSYHYSLFPNLFLSRSTADADTISTMTLIFIIKVSTTAVCSCIRMSGEKR